MQSRELAERFARSGYFDLERLPAGPREVDALLDAGWSRSRCVIPRGFAADLAAERTARVQLLVDGSDSMTAAMIAGYAGGVAGEYSARVAAERLERLRARVRACRRSRSARASGTTPSCGACATWCPACSR